MPNGAVIAAALTDHSAHPFSLTLGGIDVTKEAGGSGFGVDPTSIHVVEAGPGGVSSISFDIDDPLQQIAITDGSEIQFWNLTANNCLFRGYVDQWSSRPDFGGQGRTWGVQGIGVEAILDWTICPTLTFNGNPTFSFMCALLTGLYAPMLRAPMIDGWVGSPGAPYTRSGSFTYPVGYMSDGTGGMDIAGWMSPTVTATGTLRRVLEDYLTTCYRTQGINGPAVQASILMTVDFYMGLRVWEDQIAFQPDDYTTLTINDVYGGAIVADSLSYETEPGNVYREVYVEGSAAANSGFFGDGTGIFGRTGLLQNSDIDSPAKAAAQAATFIAAQSIPARGSFRLMDWTPPTTVHAGSLVSITDAASGATGTYRIMEIAKDWNNSSRENWTVHFGGLRRSAISAIRTLTRDVRAYGHI